MLRTMVKSKLHGCTITAVNLNYGGSITIDARLMEAADLLPDEQVQVVCLENGARFVTYVIEGERDSGIIELNGPAARQAMVGDHVHIISYVQMTEEEARNSKMKVVQVGEGNRITAIK